MNELAALSLRRLQVFLVVARHLHIGRAAEQLGIAQPAVSQQIAALEEALGVRLFHRRKRGIDLTHAGIAYRDACASLLDRHHADAETARRTARGEAGRLAIGYVVSAMFGDTLPALLRHVRDERPGLALELHEGNIGSVLRQLEEGRIDVALVRAPLTLAPGWRHLALAPQPLRLALPESHVLAGRDHATLADLDGLPLISYSDPGDFGVMQVMSHLAREAGFSLNVQWTSSSVTGVLGLVAAGLGSGIVPEGLAQLNPARIVLRPIVHPEAVASLWFVWDEARVSPALQWTLDEIDRRLAAQER
ncbi:LysR substrate-binding domain-containing protein [Novosphingobium sp.]|uniref:LysR family transcriptional regulator n=1 Tax=Novosphingobium sp. TaxID=1874826 RepID=UPI0031D59BA6